MEFSEEIKEIRKALGLSQRRLSKITGLPRRTVQDWEAGSFEPSTQFMRDAIIEKLKRLKIP